MDMTQCRSRTATDSQQSRVPVKFDEYEKLPHYFFAFPSPHLDTLRQDYLKKTADGIRWVIDSDE